MGKIIYILSDNRSGSTLLDQLLGAHDQVISLGEVHHLPAYVYEDRTLYDPVHALNCSCGLKVALCPFWQSVERELARSLKSLVLALRFIATSRSAGQLAALNTLPKRVVSQHPSVFLNSFVRLAFSGVRVASDSFALFDAIFSVTGVKYLVDSSKCPFRFRSLYEHQPDNLLGILLSRDYRGAVHSKMKRGGDMASSAKAWALRMRQIQLLTHDIPKQRLVRVKYEDLCEDPRGVIGRLCDFLELDFNESLLARPTANVHHIGGSPSKFDPSRTAIKLDSSHLSAFTETDLLVMKEIVGDSAVEWGYD